MNIVLIGLYCAISLFMLGGCFGFIAFGLAELARRQALLREAQRND